MDWIPQIQIGGETGWVYFSKGKEALLVTAIFLILAGIKFFKKE